MLKSPAIGFPSAKFLLASVVVNKESIPSTSPDWRRNEEIRPGIFLLQNRAAWESTGYPIFVKRMESQQETWVHEHAYHEIVLVESGTAEHFTAGGVQKLRSGDLIVLKPRVWHQYLNPKNFRIVNCLFDRRVLRHQQTFLSLIEGAFELFRKPPRHPQTTPPAVLHASPTQQVRIKEVLNAMISERVEKRPDWEAAMTVHLLDIIVSISRLSHGAFQEKQEDVSARIRDFVNEITEFLDSRFREPFSLEKLSKQFHVSPSYLSRTFSKRMGMGLVDYVHHLRIEEACRLLRSTNWSISRIAGEVGYDEVPYFSRRFRKDIGKTSSEYRSTLGSL